MIRYTSDVVLPRIAAALEKLAGEPRVPVRRRVSLPLAARASATT